MTSLVTYKTRDSAVARLKKLGVTKENYNSFLIFDGGKVSFNLDIVEASLKKPPAKTTKKPRETSTKTVAAVARQAINDGMTNAEVWKHLCAEFPNLTDKQKGYPAWYRSEMKRKEAKK